ncbi:esterase/lipase family protein [Nocardia sp. NPDC057663]|uniref:esterase/lipase family protein n=1 Tax=Nocardia sp. NPDC057663 TaxID=3346201 RepID=UPI00366FAF20
MSKNDLIVVLPGIMGSTLTQHGKPIWKPSAGAVLHAISTLGRSIKELRLPDGIGDNRPGDGVTPVALMPDLHVIPGLWTPIHGYTRLLAHLDRLVETGGIGKVVAFPYDWRLSNRYNATRLARVVADELGAWRDSHPTRADARVVFVCHSMGGLIARHYIEHHGGAEHTRALITVGTPYRGAAKAVDQLVNGVRKNIGPFGIDVTDFARSLPSTHQLLPDYACIDHAGALHRLDEITIPELDSRMLADGLAFHTELTTAETNRPAGRETTHAIIGVRQTTATTLRLDNGRLEPLDTIDGNNDYGDATVPLAGALRHDLAPDTNRIRRVVENHGALQNHPAVLDEIESILTAPVRRRAPDTIPVRVTAPELLTTGEPLTATIDIEPGDRRTPAIQAQLISESGAHTHPTQQPRIRNNHAHVTFPPPPPGAHTLLITGTTTPTLVTPVTHTLLVWQ